MEIGKGPNVKFLIETDRADGTDGTDSILTPVWRLVVTGGRWWCMSSVLGIVNTTSTEARY